MMKSNAWYLHFKIFISEEYQEMLELIGAEKGVSVLGGCSFSVGG